MQIQVPDIHEPTKPNPGLVAIMNARVREEALSSMMKHVRDQASMMNRIRWEERTEHTDGPDASGQSRKARPNPRGSQGVKDSLTEGADALETRFVRCALSEIVDEIKLEGKQRKELMEQRREGARARRLEAEKQANAALVKAEEERARRRCYTVRSVDRLGNETDDCVGVGRRVPDPGPLRSKKPEPNNAEHYLALAAAKVTSAGQGRSP